MAEYDTEQNEGLGSILLKYTKQTVEIPVKLSAGVLESGFVGPTFRRMVREDSYGSGEDLIGYLFLEGTSYVLNVAVPLVAAAIDLRLGAAAVAANLLSWGHEKLRKKPDQTESNLENKIE
jgi:hypothetical protein